MPDVMLICGFMRVLLRLVCVREDVDCFGRSGTKGKTWFGNY
jgi:hypothetical protein